MVNAILSLAALGLAAASGFSILQHPFGGMRAPGYLVLWLLGVVGLNRGFAALQGLARPGRGRAVLRVCKWLLPWFLPIGMISAVEARVQALQLEIASRELAPIIAFGKSPAARSEMPPAVQFPVPVHYFPPAALWLTVPAIDLDGFTLLYDFGDGQWKRFHNDTPDATFAGGGCVLKAAEWNCDALPAQ
jgi:hypothetical protein